MLIQKKVKITNDNGYVYSNCVCPNRSVEFAAEIPESAIVDCVKVNSKTIDSLAIDAIVSYPKGINFEGQRVVALVRYLDEPNGDSLYKKAQMGELADFEVYYHEVAVTE